MRSAKREPAGILGAAKWNWHFGGNLLGAELALVLTLMGHITASDRQSRGLSGRALKG